MEYYLKLNLDKNTLTKEEIYFLEKEVQKYLLKLGLSEILLKEEDFVGGKYLVTKKDDSFIYQFFERGMPQYERKVLTLDDILYIYFKSFVFSIASNWEVKNRKQGESFRRQLFCKELELMHKVNTNWHLKLKEETGEILERVPFDDGKGDFQCKYF